MKIRRGDTVVVLSGNDRGKTGRVLRVDVSSERVVVEGVRLMKRHARPTQRNPKGGIVEREGTIHLSNVALYCTKCSKKTDAVRKVVDGKSSRICKKCGEPFEAAK